MNVRQRINNFFGTPKLLFICISFALDILPLLIMVPLTPLVILEVVDEDQSKAALISGFAIGTGSLCGFISSPVLGILSDRYGRKPFLILNVIAVGINLSGLLTVYHTRQIWVTFLSHAIAGLITSTWAMSFVYVADITTEVNRSEAYGRLGASAGIAAVIGPALASSASIHHLSTPILVGLAVVGVNLIFTVFVLPESHEKNTETPLAFRHVNTYSSFKHLFSNKLVFGLAIGFCLNQICQFGVLGSSVLYDKLQFGWTAVEIGLSFAVFGLVLMIVQGLLIKPSIKYLGERTTISTGIMLTCIVTILFAVINGWAQFALIPFKALGSIATPVIQALISKQFGEDVQGKLLGALGGLQTLSGFIGPVLFSSLYSHFTSDKADVFLPQIIYYVAAGVEFLSFCIIGIFFYKFPVAQPVPADIEIVTTQGFETMPVKSDKEDKINTPGA